MKSELVGLSGGERTRDTFPFTSCSDAKNSNQENVISFVRAYKKCDGVEFSAVIFFNARMILCTSDFFNNRVNNDNRSCIEKSRARC
jgi:hypothetical protein